jgi:quinol-cytochrome oxidoreductase complex cytochrome b subunit
MGFLLGMTLGLQIVRGVVLSIIYSAQTDLAFTVILSIIQDINSGWVTRILHANGASLFFVLIYFHTARGIYFLSRGNKPKV